MKTLHQFLDESKDLRKHLDQNSIHAQEDDRSWYSHDKKTGEHTIRSGFYYKHGKTSADHAAAVSKDLHSIGIKHTITGHGEENKPFRGGAATKNSSHFWAKFKVHE